MLPTRKPVVTLHINGQAIRTTGEHPFWVYNKGWLPAKQLQPGDMLVGRDGQIMPVGEVYDTGEYETVYNLRVAEHHTYFVGSPEWGFSVWAHNADYAETFFQANPSLRGQVWVHHSIPQAILKRYPGLFTRAELDALSNLRGIPNAINRTFHLSFLNRAWDNFYRNYPGASRGTIEHYADLIDRLVGFKFLPPL